MAKAIQLFVATVFNENTSVRNQTIRVLFNTTYTALHVFGLYAGHLQVLSDNITKVNLLIFLCVFRFCFRFRLEGT
jgi:hypothetical protein